MKEEQINFVMIGGMPQAGSTLCFNLIRLIAVAGDHGVMIFAQLQDRAVATSPGTHPEYLLVKQHDLPVAAQIRQWEGKDCPKIRTWFDEGSGTRVTSRDYVVTVKRDLRDTVASAVRKDTPLSLKEICERNISWLETWNDLPDYEFVYEDYVDNPIKIARELCETINIKLTDTVLEAVVNVAENLKKEIFNLQTEEHKEMFYKMTKMTPDQITNNGKVGGYKDTLTPEQVDFIEENYKDWLVKNGYMK